MRNSTKETGRRGEEIADAYLKKKGYRIRERNYRCPVGEIDIIALDGDEVVFVEVKSRKSDDFGEPEAAVDARKQAKLSRIALNYINEHNLNDRNAQFFRWSRPRTTYQKRLRSYLLRGTL
jgi:putative endonuclease